MGDNLQLTVNGRGAELAFNWLAIGPVLPEGLDACLGKQPPHFQD